MPQSLARVLIHITFSTKERDPSIPDNVRGDLHAYMAAVLANAGCPAIIAGGVADHVHLLVLLSRTISIAALVEEVKTASSRWMKTKGVPTFAWQTGYAAFSVSESQESRLVRYIARQSEHHRSDDFRAEYRGLLERHKVVFDERYVWD